MTVGHRPWTGKAVRRGTDCAFYLLFGERLRRTVPGSNT